jgi:hypothetical protein
VSVSRGRIRRAVVRVVAVMLGLALAEAILQVVSRVSPAAGAVLGPNVTWVEDPVLGWRGTPRFVEHDAAGYRNVNRPQRAPIVVLGDSMTYGTGVSPAESWPRLLEAAAGQRVYNMAFPGYCPAHSLLQFEEALSLHPRVLIVSVYTGNDFLDALGVALLNPAIASLAPDGVGASAAREAQGALVEEVSALFPVESTNVVTKTSADLWAWLSWNSRLVGLARAVKQALKPPVVPLLAAADLEAAVAGLTPAQRQVSQIVDQPGWRTILSPQYRGRVLDDTDVRIREGFEVVEGALREMGRRGRDAGVRILVVVLPTKETVFWPHADQTDRELARLVTDEARLTGELTSFLESRGIEVIEVLDLLRDSPSQPYFENIDSHPNALGHRLIAGAVSRRLL